MHLVNDIIAFLAANLILSQALGISTMFIAASSRKSLIATACCITVFTTGGTAAAYLIDSQLTSDLDYLKLLFYTLTVGAMYIALLAAIYFISRDKFEKIRKYVHLSAFNCAVMGTFFTMSEKAEHDSSLMNAGEYLRFGFEAGLGFIAAALILTAAYRKLNSAKVPASFRGFPAMLVYIGIISMAVYSLK